MAPSTRRPTLPAVWLVKLGIYVVATLVLVAWGCWIFVYDGLRQARQLASPFPPGLRDLAETVIVTIVVYAPPALYAAAVFAVTRTYAAILARTASPELRADMFMERLRDADAHSANPDSAPSARVDGYEEGLRIAHEDALQTMENTIQAMRQGPGFSAADEAEFRREFLESLSSVETDLQKKAQRYRSDPSLLDEHLRDLIKEAYEKDAEDRRTRRST